MPSRGDVVSRAASSGAGAVDLPNAAPAPTARPDVVWTRAEGATPYAGLVEPIPSAAR